VSGETYEMLGRNVTVKGMPLLGARFEVASRKPAMLELSLT